MKIKIEFVDSKQQQNENKMTSEDKTDMEMDKPDDNTEKEKEKAKSTLDPTLPPSIANGANTTNGASNGFRVRNVAEINDRAEIEGATASKRRCPVSSEEEEEENKENSHKHTKHHKSHKESDDEVPAANEETASNHDSHIPQQTAGTANNNDCAVPEPMPEIPIESEDTKEEVKIKVEPADNCEAAASSSSSIKTESQDTASGSSAQLTTVKVETPAVKVEKAAATSTSRESCRFGISCYRNIAHRQEQAHPGDFDYTRPTYPSPPAGTPPCPFGNSCYRRNPVHFQAFSHPSREEMESQTERLRRIVRNHLALRNEIEDNDSDDDDDDDDVEEPFSASSSSEYVCGGDPSESDESMADYDDCDRAEE